MAVIHDPVQNVCAFACARQGSSHKAQDVGPSPCQDAHLISSGAVAARSYVVAAVADGHGSARHDRSHVGAQLAAQAAVTAFQSFLLDHHDSARQENDAPARLADTESGTGILPVIHGQDAHATEGAGRTALVSAFKRSFPTEVTREWRKAVQEHCAKCQETTPPDYGRYGTTLLVAGMVSRLLLLAQVGDGDIVVTARRDQQQDQPLAVDDSLVAGETFSLCSEDAEKLWRTTTRDLADVAFVILSTDGLRNAYDSTDAFLRLLAAVRQNIEQCGVGRATAILPETLDRFSVGGSGDDITLVGLMVGAPPTHSIPQPGEVTGERAAVSTPDGRVEESPTKTVGTETDPPESQKDISSPALEGRPPCRPPHVSTHPDTAATVQLERSDSDA
jgi:serine/threonine protein phosphatase PrpC